MNFEKVTIEKSDGVAKLTLNRPEVLNALDIQAFDEIGEAMRVLSEDADVRAILIAAAGRAFCTGLDLTVSMSYASSTSVEFKNIIRRLQASFNSVEEIEKPVVAAVNGYALGAGCDLALACDLRIASEKAVFGEQYIKVGLMPDLGGTQRLARLVGIGKAKELIFLGDRIDAKEAERIGLVNKVVPHEELEEAAWSVAKRLASGPSVAIAMAKTAINKSYDVDIKTGLNYEVYGQAICLQTSDVREGVMAFFEKREPQFKGE